MPQINLLERNAIEGSIEVQREMSEEQIAGFSDFYAWSCGSRAEADMRIEQAIMNLQRIQQAMRAQAIKRRAEDKLTQITKG